MEEQPSAARKRSGVSCVTGGRARLAAVILGVGVMGLVLTGCQLSSSTSYISHRSSDGVDMYFKVPASWKVFDTNQVLEAQNGPLGPSQLKQLSSGEWLEAMSAQPGATAKDSLGIGNRYPTAIVEARQLGASEQDGMNFAAMRSELLGTDPLTTSGFQVLSYSEFTASGGVRGIRMVVNIERGSGPVHTFGQVTAVDAQTSWILAVGIGCTASCWGLNDGAIKEVLDSWTVKEQSP